jgi:hypothetical protein
MPSSLALDGAKVVGGVTFRIATDKYGPPSPSVIVPRSNGAVKNLDEDVLWCVWRQNRPWAAASRADAPCLASSLST